MGIGIGAAFADDYRIVMTNRRGRVPVFDFKPVRVDVFFITEERICTDGEAL